VGTRCADHVTPLYGGRSVGIVRSRTKATEFSLVLDLEAGFVEKNTHNLNLD
jgi:hypothetical protein